MISKRVPKIWVLAAATVLAVLAGSTAAAPPAAEGELPPVAVSPHVPEPVIEPVAVPVSEPEPVPEPEPYHPPVERVPILMYHEIAPGPNSLYVAPAELAVHLDYLRRAGYTPVTLQQVLSNFTSGGALPAKPVVLTFDDGYISFYANALPLLKEYGAPGTLFVITGYVGKPGYVTWEQVQAMAEQGIEMGAHTVHHPDMPSLKPDRLRHEIHGSKLDLEFQTGRPISFFSYPAGRYDDRSLAILREEGFAAAVITKRGMATPCQDPMLWRRVRINKGTSAAALADLLRLAESETESCSR